MFLSGLILLLGGGCTDDDAGAAVNELSTYLLEHGDVITVLPNLEAKSDYSTGEDYGVVSEADLAGPTERAEVGVVRQWSQDSHQADDGEAWTVVSSVFQFTSQTDAESAAEAVFDLMEVDPIEVGDALTALTEPEDGLSDGVIVVTRGSLMATAQAGYVGRADRPVIERLAEAAAQRLA
jgi:hypothetical protein